MQICKQQCRMLNNIVLSMMSGSSTSRTRWNAANQSEWRYTGVKLGKKTECHYGGIPIRPFSFCIPDVELKGQPTLLWRFQSNREWRVERERSSWLKSTVWAAEENAGDWNCAWLSIPVWLLMTNSAASNRMPSERDGHYELQTLHPAHRRNRLRRWCEVSCPITWVAVQCMTAWRRHL